MTKCNWITPDRFADEWNLADFFAKQNSNIQQSKGESFSWLFVKKLAMWAYDIIMPMPIRLTLENVTVFTLILIVLMPNVITYLLIYPIFRLVFGTLYPAYASYKAVRTKNVKEYVKWMMYWIVFALFTSAEIFTDMFLSFWLPFYYEIKIILVIWLLSPATKGSSILYRRFVHPALSRREAEIDEALARATEQGYAAVVHLGTKSVNYATTVLMQTAIKNLPSVVPSGSLDASQSDSAISSSATRRVSTSLSETDGPNSRTTMARCRTQRRTRSEEFDIKVGNCDEPQEAIDEYINMDYNMSIYTNNSSIDQADFKKPEVVVQLKKNKDKAETFKNSEVVGKRNKSRDKSGTLRNTEVVGKRNRNKDKSATIRKPRTRSQSNWMKCENDYDEWLYD